MTLGRGVVLYAPFISDRRSFFCSIGTISVSTVKMGGNSPVAATFEVLLALEGDRPPPMPTLYSVHVLR